MNCNIILFILLQITSCLAGKPTMQNNVPILTVMDQQDSLLLSDCLVRFSQKKKLPPNLLLTEIAKSFIGSPYAAGTLEKGSSEKLIVNLHEFDCTTLVETCLALQKTIRSDSPTIEGYLSNLKKIRYRNGTIEGYSSRLHYFSEWISANEKNGSINDITCNFHKQARSKKINFMSQHVQAYRQLNEDDLLVDSIAKIEERISGLGGCFVPKDRVQNYCNLFEDGMIIGITTTIEGLDFVHTGIIIRNDGKVYLLHASSEQANVCISTVPLSDYLMANKRQSGIVVLKVTE
jgi:hypothetical protein